MLRNITPFTVLSIIIILLYACICVIGFFVPLQIDEIGWAYVNHRAIADNYQMIILFPQCQPPATFAKTLPIIWYPHAWVNNILFMQYDSPILYKAIGMLRFLLILIASWFVIKPISATLKLKTENLFILFLALLGLDEIPFLLQVNRPEQTILLSVLIFMGLALNAQLITGRIAKCASALLFIIAVLLLYPAHAKAIATLPIMAVCAWALFHRISANRFITFLTVSLFFLFAIASVTIWFERYSCPDSAFGQFVLASNSLMFDKILTDPIMFVSVMVNSFLLGLLYDYNIHLHVLTHVDWLEEGIFLLPDWLHNLDTGTMILWGCLRLFVLILCFLIAFRTIFYACKIRSVSLQEIIFCTLFLTLISLILVSGIQRMWYFPALQIPLLIICSFLSFSAKPGFKTKFFAYAKFVLLIMAIINLLTLVYRYNAFIYEPAQRFKALSDRRPIYMESPLDYENKKVHIYKAYSACKLPSVRDAKHLFLDRTTYPSFKHSFQPFDFDFSSEWQNFTIKKLFKLISDYNSSGIIISCYQVPAQLKPYLIETEGYCCASAEHIKAMKEKLNQ